MRCISFPGILNGEALSEFPGLDELTSARFQRSKPAYTNTRGLKSIFGFAMFTRSSAICTSHRTPNGFRSRLCQGGVRRAAAVSSRAVGRTRTAALLQLRVGLRSSYPMLPSTGT